MEKIRISEGTRQKIRIGEHFELLDFELVSLDCIFDFVSKIRVFPRSSFLGNSNMRKLAFATEHEEMGWALAAGERGRRRRNKKKKKRYGENKCK